MLTNIKTPVRSMMNQENNLRLYMWKFQTKYTIFAMAPNVEEAKAIAIKKAGGSLKEQVAHAVETQKPIEYDETHSFIFEVGAQLIG